MKTDLFNKPHNAESKLKNRFIFSPFSVLDVTVIDGKNGRWQNRKREWVNLGIQSEIGRGEDLLDPSCAKQFQAQNKLSPGGSPRPACDYSKKERGNGSGKPLHKKKINRLTIKGSGSVAGVYEEGGGGTSIFDPVLCEVMYQWFCPSGGKIFDPFAGGSVRGIVANYMGYNYTGIELSKTQVLANRGQAKIIIPNNKPKWIVGDSLQCRKLARNKYDFLFSCPPYADLEVYSDDPRDISNMPYDKFMKVYTTIIRKSVSMLKQNRFACFVVDEIRDKKTGLYRNFVSDTISAFLQAGCGYYNDMVLVTPIGSLPIRITRQFNSGRKIGKTHQNILVFYKGDTKKIKSTVVKCNIKKFEIENLKVK